MLSATAPLALQENVSDGAKIVGPGSIWDQSVLRITVAGFPAATV